MNFFFLLKINNKNFFNYFIGQNVVIELKNDKIITGILDECDKTMNINLINTLEYESYKNYKSNIPLFNDIKKIYQLKGSSIRYIHIPDNIDNFSYHVNNHNKTLNKIIKQNKPREIVNKNDRKKKEQQKNIKYEDIYLELKETD